jgi:hypothetical protein
MRANSDQHPYRLDLDDVKREYLAILRKGSVVRRRFLQRARAGNVPVRGNPIPTFIPIITPIQASVGTAAPIMVTVRRSTAADFTQVADFMLARAGSGN